MYISLSLLQTFLSSPLSIQQILEACDRIGIEAEYQLPSYSPLVVTAKIISTSPHPSADRLKVATLFDGSSQHQIVCGADNCREGIIVPLALPGAKLTSADGSVVTIKKSKLRGIESHGMCCGADEIGFPHLQQSERGLFEFPTDTKLGENAILLLADPLIEYSLTPNLSHCASLLGLSREIAFVSPDTELSIPSTFSFQPLTQQKEKFDAHDIHSAPFFCSVVISGVNAIESPAYIQETLLRCKQKPINLLVDITNYIMLTLGQPLHAYDASSMDPYSLHAYTLPQEQNLILLNDQTVRIPSGALVIRDNNTILGLAGIMGCKQSAIHSNTQNIVLESAYFHPNNVRFTQNQTRMHTEASYRFTRGIDPQMTLPALYAAIHCLQQICPEAKVSPIRILGDIPALQASISLKTQTLSRILGVQMSSEEVCQKLSSLGFQAETNNNAISVTPPSYRHDIVEEMDLVEEIFRIQPVSPKIHKPKHVVFPPVYALKRQLTTFLTASGIQQFFTCDLLDPTNAKLDLSQEPAIYLQGSQHTLTLRRSLLPGLLASVATNLHRQQNKIQAFEIGATYKLVNDSYKETEHLAMILAGQENTSWIHSEPVSFYTLKGRVEALLKHIRINNYTIQRNLSPNFHPKQQAEVFVGKQLLGFFGMVHPHLCKKAQIRAPIFFAEFSIPLLLQFQKKKIAAYQPYPIYPSSFRDITLTVDSTIPADLLRQKLSKFGSKWLERVFIISVYQNKDHVLPTKNISLRLIYQDYGKTLSNQEIDQEHERLVTLLNQELEQLRGNSNS